MDEHEKTSYHHEMSILGFVHHGLLPSAEVHRILFPWLDFNLDTRNQTQSVLGQRTY